MASTTVKTPIAINTPINRFTLFSSLSKELRLQIWEYAANLPRIISISWDKNLGCKTAKSGGPLPSILHTNWESRYVALKYYSLSFHTRLTRPIYFNSIPGVDTLLFLERAALFAFTFDVHNPDGWNKAVQRFEVVIDDHFQDFHECSFIHDLVVWQMKNLQDFVIHFHKPKPAGDEHFYFGNFKKCLETVWGKYHGKRRRPPVVSATYGLPTLPTTRVGWLIHIYPPSTSIQVEGRKSELFPKKRSPFRFRASRR